MVFLSSRVEVPSSAWVVGGAGGWCPGPGLWHVSASACTQPQGWLALLGACVDTWHFLRDCPSVLCYWIPSEGINVGGRDALGLVVEICCCSEPTAEKPHWNWRKQDWDGLASRAFTLQPRLAVEESASQMSQDKLPSNQPCWRGSSLEGDTQCWCFPSLAWHGSIFSLLFGTSYRRLQQTIPCCSLGGFMTVNNSFPSFQVFWVYGGVFLCKSQSLATFTSCLRLFNNIQISAQNRAAGFWVTTVLAVLLTAPCILCWRIA